MLPIGLKIQIIYSQKNFRHRIIINVAKLFNLSEYEKEKLANQAGFTLNRTNDFIDYLNLLIHLSSKKHKNIYDKALISDRMYRRIKTDYHPTKASLLALAISLELETDKINLLLQKAGYVLSKSIAFDMVVRYLLENSKMTKDLFYINQVLYELDLPLLMTREKS